MTTKQKVQLRQKQTADLLARGHIVIAADERSRIESADFGLGEYETFRCRRGTVHLCVPGSAAAKPRGKAPAGREKRSTVWHEAVLSPGEQYTLQPDTLHWFQGGPEGTVVSEFSTRSTDEADVFTDPDIHRMPEVADR